MSLGSEAKRQGATERTDVIVVDAVAAVNREVEKINKIFQNKSLSLDGVLVCMCMGGDLFSAMHKAIHYGAFMAS